MLFLSAALDCFLNHIFSNEFSGVVSVVGDNHCDECREPGTARAQIQLAMVDTVDFALPRSCRFLLFHGTCARWCPDSCGVDDKTRQCGGFVYLRGSAAAREEP